MTKNARNMKWLKKHVEWSKSQKCEIVKQEENVKCSEKAENVQCMKRKTIPYWG